MSTSKEPGTRIGRRLAGVALPLAVCLALGATPAPGNDPCKKTALEALRSCQLEAKSDYWLQRAKCTNLPTIQAQIACTLDALSELHQQKAECWEQHVARIALCQDLGGGIYYPLIDPDDFVDVIDNPYFPLLPGTTFIYEKQTGGETEHVEVTVTHETKDILGVTCTVVHDIESVDGEVKEDTADWFAQDKLGNVWYFGELSLNFEDGQISSLGGSWQAGEDGARPGIIMEAGPQVGDLYRQEFLIREAEDVAGVLSLSEPVSVAYGSFSACLQTEDYTPLEPDQLEHKFYAPGIGLVLEVDVASGERLELIEIKFN